MSFILPLRTAFEVDFLAYVWATASKRVGGVRFGFQFGTYQQTCQRSFFANERSPASKSTHFAASIVATLFFVFVLQLIMHREGLAQRNWSSTVSIALQYVHHPSRRILLIKQKVNDSGAPYHADKWRRSKTHRAAVFSESKVFVQEAADNLFYGNNTRVYARSTHKCAAF